MKEFKIGLQLYSVRNEMSADMEKTFKEIADIGFKYVEFAGFYDKPATEIKSLLDKYGLTGISAHQVHGPILENPEKMISDFKTIGIKYCAVPYMPLEKQKGNPEFDVIADEFIRTGTLLKENGISFLYHNHEFEFKTFEDKYLLDWLYDTIPADILQTEIDTCWVRYAGVDPCEYMKKYKGRSTVLHLKDFYTTKFNAGPAYALIDEKGVAGGRSGDNSFDFRPLGSGIQSFDKILKTAEEIGIEYLIVEQDEPYNGTPLENARQSFNYITELIKSL